MFANGSDAAFEFGYGGRAGNITMEGLIFDGYHIGSIGIIWVGNAHDITLNDMTVRNSSAKSDPTMSWALYVSMDGGQGGTNITADNWTVTGSSRQISALQIQYQPLHQHIHMSGWTVSHCAFALYANGVVTDLRIDGWTITDSGVHSSSVYFSTVAGKFSNMHATNSLPLLDESPTMIDGGGNLFS